MIIPILITSAKALHTIRKIREKNLLLRFAGKAFLREVTTPDIFTLFDEIDFTFYY
tara:strand:+ start:1087 stop:1254 length:168 start_codon:yes stop_codon:yes gene_type:complete